MGQVTLSVADAARLPLRAALLVCSLLASARPCDARDVPQGVALNWVRLQGAEACLPASELSERVERRLERSLFVVDAAAVLSIDGAVQPSAAGFHVRLALSDRAGRVLGERMLESADVDCRKLDEAVVLVIAVMLFPQGALAADGGRALDTGSDRLLEEVFRDEPDQLELSAAEVATTAPAAADVSAPPPSNASRDAPPTVVAADSRTQTTRRELISASAAGIVAAGSLPAISTGIEIAVLVSPSGLWPLRLSAAYFPEQQRRASQLSSGATSFGLSQVAAAVCPWQLGVDLHAQLCGGLALGLLRVTSVGYAQGSIHESDPTLDAQAQFDVQWHVLDHVLVQLGTGLALPMIQHSYAYQGLDAQSRPLFRTAQLSGRVGLGLGVGF
jgi:hypothetical protein